MKRPLSNLLFLLTVIATFVVLLGPFIQFLHPKDMAIMTTSIGVMGAIYFSMVSPERDKVSPLITLLFLGFTAVSTTAGGAIIYQGNLQKILIGLSFIILVLMEFGVWYYTIIVEIDDVTPAMEKILPEKAIPNNPTDYKLNDPSDRTKDLNRRR